MLRFSRRPSPDAWFVVRCVTTSASSWVRRCRASSSSAKKRVEVSYGLKASEFKNIDKNGVTATVIINDDVKRVTEITIGTGKKK